MDKTLIAPCGMNCGICLGYLREKKKCPGCNDNSRQKSVSRQRCIIRNCDIIKHNESKLCYECDKFPCARLKRLDERYRKNYSMSMIENLEQIKSLGMDIFLEKQEAKYQCKKCGGTICVHRGYCFTCSDNK